MNIHLGNKTVLPAVLVLILLGGGVAVGQTEQPPWSGELLHDFREWSVDYNDDPEAVGFTGKSLLRNEVVNLYVRGEAGVAKYSFTTDSRVRVTELREGLRDDATVRVTTERTVVEDLTTEDRPVAALGSAFLSGDIHVKKLFRVMGETIAVGVVEVTGTLAVVAGAAVATKTGLLGWLSSALGKIESFLLRLAGSLAVLEMLGVDVKGKLRALWKRLASPFGGKSGSVSEPPAGDEPPADPEGESRTDPEPELPTGPERTG